MIIYNTHFIDNNYYYLNKDVIVMIQSLLYNYIGMFIVGFLSSPYFLDVAPGGVMLPFNVSNGTTDDNNAAGIVNVGYVAFFATLIFGLLMIN